MGLLLHRDLRQLFEYFFLLLWIVQSAETRIKNSLFAEWFSPKRRAGFFLAISVALNMLMAKLHSTVIGLDIWLVITFF